MITPFQKRKKLFKSFEINCKVSFVAAIMVIFLISHPFINCMALDFRAKTEYQDVSIATLPKNVREISAIAEYNLSNPYITAALTIVALNRYIDNPRDGLEILNMLKGPEPLSHRDRNFIRERLSFNKKYLPRSYFVGATPTNNYTPQAPPYRIRIKTQENSRINNGLLKLFIFSSGAATPRPITLRYKPSTKQWFLYEYSSLLSNIKAPKANNNWR